MAQRPRQRSTSSATVGYAGFAYAAFVAAAVWAVGFLADGGAPTTVDGDGAHTTWTAVAIDIGLLSLFAVQHSVMARSGVKRHLARVITPAAERSTFVLASAALLALLFWRWEPLAGTVWHVSSSPARLLLWALYLSGWIVAIASTFMIDHLDFLGLRQAVRQAHDEPHVAPEFKERWLYACVRHPMMTGLLIAFWATPTMSAGHLLFAVAASGYIAVGLQFEERDLRRELGAVYDDYAERVPAIVPRPNRVLAGSDSRVGCHVAPK